MTFTSNPIVTLTPATVGMAFRTTNCRIIAEGYGVTIDVVRDLLDTLAPTCAGDGNGYWLCDVPGGCVGCRELATAIDDADQLAEWKEAKRLHHLAGHAAITARQAHLNHLAEKASGIDYFGADTE